ncbi:MAG: 7,8-didemethyl-8-hydroxy-5-deazariboflavin synthase subunit CofH [Candidatus Thorarchaeota archaeon]
MLTNEFFNRINPKIKSILKKALNSEDDLTSEEGFELLKVTGKEFIALQNIADTICYEKKKNLVTFVINRNINFTNICFQGCKFCCFSVPNKNLGFLLTIDEIRDKVIEAKFNNCTEVCIQGGINPEVNFEFYLDILKTVKDVDRRIHTHAFSPQEIFYMAQLYGDTIENTLKELQNAGLDSIPGTAAEILVEKIRKIVCPNKVSVSQWKEIITTAHNLGIPTTSTLMYGHVEDLKDRIAHLEILRDIQRETEGFSEFVPLPFVKENSILLKQEYPIKHSYGIADLKLFCVSRLFLNNYIDNIQTSWVKLGPKFAQVSLNYGVNDFSGTIMEENISKSAGAKYGEYLSPNEIINIIKSAGKRPAQRDTVYNIIKYY